MKPERKELLYQFWAWLEPSMETYSKTISSLLAELDDIQLQEFVEARTKD